MRYVILNNDVRFPDKELTAGTILGVEDGGNEIVFILTGEFKNRSLHSDHFEEIDLLVLYQEVNQEQLQRREEVKELMGAVEMKSKGLAHANNAILKLCEEVKVLREDKALLLQQIERTLEEQPKQVVLPREVADAINSFEYINESDELFDLVYLKTCAEKYENHHANAIRTYVSSTAGNRIAYFAALVNGYTVEKEETIEDRIKKGIQEIHQGWAQSPHKYFSPDEAQAELAEQITNFVATVYKEAKQSG